MWHSAIKVCLASLLAVGAIGCGSGGTQSVDVSGTVMLDGDPLADAEVHFVNEEAKFEGFGKTDANGRYQLVGGAAPGTNKVYIRKFDTRKLPVELGNLPPSIAEDEGQIEAILEAQGYGAAGETGSGSLIPPEYSDPERTQLTFPVPEGGTDSADFKLTS